MLSIQEISNILIEQNIKPSFQRIKIYEFLLKNNIHPNIEIIYSNLSKGIPTLSKTTIYNTLKKFEEKGLILSVNIDEKEIRYDAILKTHGHFKCESCGEIFDFDYNYNDIKFKGLENFILTKTDVMVKGICNKCKLKNKK